MIVKFPLQTAGGAGAGVGTGAVPDVAPLAVVPPVELREIVHIVFGFVGLPVWKVQLAHPGVWTQRAQHAACDVFWTGFPMESFR